MDSQKLHILAKMSQLLIEHSSLLLNYKLIPTLPRANSIEGKLRIEKNEKHLLLFLEKHHPRDEMHELSDTHQTNHSPRFICTKVEEPLSNSLW